jgi:hypothetical protein
MSETEGKASVTCLLAIAEAEASKLEDENAKLLEQGARLFDKTLELGAENRKLRELVTDTLMDVHEYAEKYGIEPNYDAVNAHLDNRMRELRVEVNDG